ncbi:MAG: ABC transporter ATP-binding protein [Anaerolineae bacterium]|jgi:ATP-binding cassette subfamily B multidrug efflux pump
MQTILRVLNYVKKYWFAEAIAYLCMLGIAGGRLISPKIIERIVDLGIEQGQADILLNLVLLLIGVTLVTGLFRYGEGYLTESVSQDVSYDMRNEAYAKLQSLSFSYHDRAQTGQLLARITSDVERLRMLTGRGLLRLVDSVVLLVGTTVLLLQMNVPLALLSLAVMPAIFFIMRKYRSTQHPRFRDRQNKMAVLASRLEQNLYGMDVVRGFAQEHKEIERFGNDNRAVYDVSQAIVRLGSLVNPFVVLLASAGSVLVLWLGGRLVINGALTLGQLVAFNTYVLQLVGPMRRLGFLVTSITESQASAERVFEILDTRSEVEDRPDARPLGPIEGRVTFDNVSFGYLAGRPVLENVSFTAEPGQIIALLGPTGSGKTTITNLIPRFYDVTEGAIMVDGVDIRDVVLESLRSQIGIVMQETLLFGNTVRENIAFGRPEATQEEIEMVAQAAAAHDFITGFPNGYDTDVGERGVTLSGGQRQRIAIARALLLDPRILILDDATSSVDTDTELKIQAALDGLMAGRTTFIIAQRVSTVRNADLILVINRGRLVASGTHRQLIAESGIYADIYHRQLRQDLSETEVA